MWTGIYVFWTPFLFLCPVKHGTRGAEWTSVSRPIGILVQFWLFCWVDPPWRVVSQTKVFFNHSWRGGVGWTSCQLADGMKPGARSNLRILCNLRTWINVEVFDLHLTKPNLSSMSSPMIHEYYISRLLFCCWVHWQMFHKTKFEKTSSFLRLSLKVNYESKLWLFPQERPSLHSLKVYCIRIYASPYDH